MPVSSIISFKQNRSAESSSQVWINRINAQRDQVIITESTLQSTNFSTFATPVEINQKPAAMKPDFERLPKTVSPSHYELQLKPDLVKFSFEGSLKTSIKVSTIEATGHNEFALFRDLHRRKMKTHIRLKIMKNNQTRTRVCVRCRCYRPKKMSREFLILLW